MRLGYKVVTASNGVEALDIFKKYPISIVISDWVMPELDGLSLCRQVRQIPNKQSFFFLVTGRRKSLSDFAIARETGVDDFVYKPLDFHVFRNQLKVAERVLELKK